VLTIIKRAIAHEPIDVMMSSPHEQGANALEGPLRSILVTPRVT
jgi:hypothetical protein